MMEEGFEPTFSISFFFFFQLVMVYAVCLSNGARTSQWTDLSMKHCAASER